MESIIGYIIFAVIALVIARASKKNKKKSVPTQYTQGKKKYALSDIDKMLGNIQQNMNPEPPLEEESNLEKYEPKEREIKEVRDHHNRNHRFGGNDSEVAKVDKKEGTEFDLKTAVIYSTILDRKKF